MLFIILLIAATLKFYGGDQFTEITSWWVVTVFVTLGILNLIRRNIRLVKGKETKVSKALREFYTNMNEKVPNPNTTVGTLLFSFFVYAVVLSVTVGILSYINPTLWPAILAYAVVSIIAYSGNQYFVLTKKVSSETVSE